MVSAPNRHVNQHGSEVQPDVSDRKFRGESEGIAGGLPSDQLEQFLGRRPVAAIAGGSYSR